MSATAIQQHHGGGMFPLLSQQPRRSARRLLAALTQVETLSQFFDISHTLSAGYFAAGRDTINNPANVLESRFCLSTNIT